MRIDNIILNRSPIADTGRFVLHIEVQGLKYTGYFDDMGGFLTAVADAAKFFAVRLGLMKNRDAKATREIQDVRPH